MYAPGMAPVAAPRYGDPRAAYETAQANSIMRREGESSDPTAGGNVYTGARDEYGRRHGQGKFVFADGSEYEGEWMHGLRHGIGIFKYKDGGKYRGQWFNDLKHGQGRFDFANGDSVLGIWTHDRLNGLGKLTEKGSSVAEEVIYKDDMLIKVAKKGLSCSEQFYVIMSIFLLAGFYASIVAAVVTNNYDIFGGCSVILIYWIWSCFTSSSSYIRNTENIGQVYRNVDAAIAAPPTITFTIQNYHYETHHFTEKDADGNVRHRTEQRRVNTHYARENFRFSVCVD